MWNEGTAGDVEAEAVIVGGGISGIFLLSMIKRRCILTFNSRNVHGHQAPGGRHSADSDC